MCTSHCRRSSTGTRSDAVAPATGSRPGHDLLRPQRAHDLGRAGEAHVDLRRAGPCASRDRARATGTFVNGRSTTSRPISTVADTLGASYVEPPRGRSIASWRVYVPSVSPVTSNASARACWRTMTSLFGAAHAHRSRDRPPARPSPRSRAPASRRSPTSTGTSRDDLVFPRQIDRRRVDLLDPQARRHRDHRRVERRRASRCRRGGRPGRCRCRRRAGRRASARGPRTVTRICVGIGVTSIAVRASSGVTRDAR